MGISLRAELLRWWATIQVGWSKSMAYKLNFFLLIIGPTIVFFFIKFNLWTSIYASSDQTEIQGFTLSKMLTYQCWVMVVGFLAQGHNSMALAEDIRLGRISAYLVYPFDFWRFHAAEFIGFQVLQTFVATLTIAIVIGTGFATWPGFEAVFKGVVFCWLVGCLWFSCQFTLGLMAFWLEESWTLRVMFSIIVQFLSGAIIPLDFYPSWFTRWIKFLPFADMTYTPTLILMGDYTEPFIWAVVRIVGWMGVTITLASIVWRRGLRMYTGAGM